MKQHMTGVGRIHESEVETTHSFPRVMSKVNLLTLCRTCSEVFDYDRNAVQISLTLSKIQVGFTSLDSMSSIVASPDSTHIVSTPAFLPVAMSV